jgi:hypothetical protein
VRIPVFVACLQCQGVLKTAISITGLSSAVPSLPARAQVRSPAPPMRIHACNGLVCVQKKNMYSEAAAAAGGAEYKADF